MLQIRSPPHCLSQDMTYSILFNTDIAALRAVFSSMVCEIELQFLLSTDSSRNNSAYLSLHALGGGGVKMG